MIALTGEDDRYAYARHAGMRIAREEALPLILYDVDAASLLNEPLPSGWSADGAPDQYGDRLTADELDRLGRGPIARQVEEAEAAGVEAYGWLPTSHGPDPLADYARRQGARVLIMPADREEVDPLTAILVGTLHPIDRLEEEAPARILVAHPDGTLERR
ncbi:MAG: hypothetical protein M3253_09045 [Chloroflexota bacterium]|nr:hypothetical protein [Chloroflexota bacterium]